MPKLLVKNVRLSFPSLFEPQTFGEGEPAYSAKFIIDPKDPNVKVLRDAMALAAKEKWAEKGADVLKFLIENKKVAFVEGTYKNQKGDTYDGYEGMYYLSARNPKVKPTTFDAHNNSVGEKDGVIYNGCYVDASVEIYAQDNSFGRRINCSLRGVRFAGHGESFGGGAPASADDFGAPAPAAVADDFV
jgi:hypothetical protein